LKEVYIDIQGDKYLARIVKVFPPRSLKTPTSTPSSASAPLKLKLKLSNSSLGGVPPVNGANGVNGAHFIPLDGASESAQKTPSKYKPLPTQRVARSYPSAPSSSTTPVATSPLTSGSESITEGKLLAPVPILESCSASTSPTEPVIHTIGADLKLSLEEAIKLDDPNGYYYSVQMLGEGADNADASTSISAPDMSRWAGSEMEVTCAVMSRDRLGFNKALLKRFLKDALDRDNAIASPWVVKPPLAEKYGIETEMPQEVKEGVEGVKKADHEKRRRIWEEREGPPNKRKKLSEEEKGRMHRLIDDILG
jgi:hypothetical protein